MLDIVKQDIIMMENIDITDEKSIIKWQNALNDNNNYVGKFNTYEEMFLYLNSQKSLKLSTKIEMILSLEKWSRPFDIELFANILSITVNYDLSPAVMANMFLIPKNVLITEDTKLFNINSNLSMNANFLLVAKMFNDYIREYISNNSEVITDTYRIENGILIRKKIR